LTVLFIGVSFFIFNSFYEGLFFGMMIDLLYFVPREPLYDLPAVFICSLFFFLLSKVLYKQLRIKN